MMRLNTCPTSLLRMTRLMHGVRPQLALGCLLLSVGLSGCGTGGLRLPLWNGSRGGDGAQVVLAQPAAGKGVGGEQLQFVALERDTGRWTNPGLKGGLGEVPLECFLNLTPQRFSLLHRHVVPWGS